MERTRRPGGVRLGIAVGAAIALVGMAFGVTVASIPSSAGTISACYATTTGALRVIDYPSHRCARGERMLTWNQASPTGAVPLLALAGSPCSGVGAAGTLSLDVTPGTGVVTLTCKVAVKVQSSIKLVAIEVTAGPPDQRVTRQCLDATSCSAQVPFGSPVDILLTANTNFTYTCPGFAATLTGAPNTDRTQWSATCSQVSVSASATIVVGKL